MSKKIFQPIYAFKVNGKELRKARMRAYLNQKTLAKMSGISNVFLCDLEHGNRNCSSETKDKIISALAKAKALALAESNAGDWKAE